MGKVLIVGGGAAGMVASIAAAVNGNEVHVYEKNEKLGKKVYITGKGRCNVTNACDLDGLMAGMVTNARFLYSGFHKFDNSDMMELLKECGCPLKTERGRRVFPVSDKSSDVIRALSGRMIELGVKVHCGARVKRLVILEGICRGISLDSGDRRVDGDAVIVATGGLSYPVTGSTGDGYEFARRAGLAVTSLTPALVPLVTKEPVSEDLQGLSLKNIEAVIRKGDRELYREFGEMLFTHFGVSGPVMLSASSYVAKELEDGPLVLSIDLKPALLPEQLDARILREFEESANRQFKNSLSRLFPAKLVLVMVERSGIPPEKKVNEVTRAERRRLVDVTKAFCLTLTGVRGYSEAIVTQGGVDVKEIKPSTMEAKKAHGLYFAGEVLDLDGITGGFNLQIAWTTGWMAGSSVY